MHDRAQLIDQAFCHRVMHGDLPVINHRLTPAQVGVTGDELVDLFESQLMSRQLDLQSRKLRARDVCYYTIGSAGHEGNAVLGKLFRLTDMAFLHYRSCALMIQRSKQLPGQTPLKDILLSFVASRDDPIAGGRHKVFGSLDLLVPPQTSTIASHLPKAMGTAHAIALADRMGITPARMQRDSVVLCSFGDASANHSTAQGAINTACWAAYQNSPMPIVFVCEDNGVGISTSTPLDWIESSFCHRPGLHYLSCDGTDLLDSIRKSRQAIEYARLHRRPVFLHMKLVRLMGHAGADNELSYHTLEQIEQCESKDPLLSSAAIILEHKILTADDICRRYQQIAEQIASIAEAVMVQPKLTTAAEVMASISPERNDIAPMPLADKTARQVLFAKDKQPLNSSQNMARLINMALADILLQYPASVICGEDVGKKGGVYSVTRGLVDKFGAHRVINTLLDEQSVLGLALGLSHAGFLPIPEIQFLAYVHNAEDQIRGEAATLSFFSQGQFTNPMVIRIAGLAYQRGFGGHFHNDNSLAVFRDIPGLVIACPSNGRDAVSMLRSAVAYAYEQRRVVVFIEPIALYMTRDLLNPGDDLWAANYPLPDDDECIPVGQFGIWGEGSDICLISYGNGYYLSRQAAEILRVDHDINLRIIDLRWLAPLKELSLVEAISPCRKVLVVDECRRSGNISEALFTLIQEHTNSSYQISRVTAEDSFIPLAEAANLVLPSKEAIVSGVLRLLNVDDCSAVQDSPLKI